MSDAQLSFRKSANIDRVTDKRKDSLFRLVDTDGSGTIDAQEFAVLYDAIKKDLAEELEKEAALAKEASSAKRRFKMLLLFVAVLVSFLAASVAANFAVIFTVVDQAITTTTTSTGILEVKGSDTIAKTATATQDLPLIVAPALDLETLAQVKSLAVKYQDGLQGGVVEASVTVVSVRKHNATFVEFVTSDPSEMIETLNGHASLVRYPTSTNKLSQMTKVTLCAANATCSAFRASGIDTDAAFDLAKEELRNAGFSDVARRLDGWSNPYATAACSSGAWYLTPECGYAYTPVSLSAVGWWTKFSWNNNCFSGSLNHAAWNNNFPWAWGPTAKPPPMGSLGVMSHSTYSGKRHLVFMMHGKAQRWSSMWALYCPAAEADEMVTHNANGGNTNTDPCPALGGAWSVHLVYAFIGSGVEDTAFSSAAGFSSDIYQSAYGTAVTAIETDVMSHITSVAGKIGWDTTSMDMFDSMTEIMAVGFSDGAGCGMYMQWTKAFTGSMKGITQVIAVDFWAFNDYSVWLPATSPPGTLDAKIYTNCYSGIFLDGPAKAIFPSSASDTSTYVQLSGGFTGPETSSGYWTTYEWEKSDGSCQRFQYWVHGMSTVGSPSDWVGDDPWWASVCTATNMQPAPVNSSVHWAVALETTALVIGDIEDWVAAPSSWDPNAPSSIPCYDSPSPPPPSPVYKPPIIKPKPWHKGSKKDMMFKLDKETMEKDMKNWRFFGGRRMEEREMAGSESVTDIIELALEEEMMTIKPLPTKYLSDAEPKKPKDATGRTLSSVDLKKKKEMEYKEYKDFEKYYKKEKMPEKKK